MRGTRAKLLRKQAGLDTGKRYTYRMENTKARYLTGGSIKAGYLWGWWFHFYTLISTGSRMQYQNLKKAWMAAMLVLILSGCSAVVGKVTEIAGNDLARTSELAAKYGKPQVQQCSDFMLAQVAKLQSADANLAALRAEPTAGLFSAALKSALVAEALKNLETLNGPTFKAEFKAACSEVAGDILFNVMSDAARIVGR